jgi:hypothetical protein
VNLILYYMKLFDYKFLILLGLTLVVYFLYREILDLKGKLSTVENKVETSLTNIKNANNKLRNQNTRELSYTQSEELVKKQNPVHFQIPLPPPPKKEEKRELNNGIPNLVHNADDSEDIEQLNNSGEQVAIYSNDNENTQSYSIGESSLLDSSNIIDEEDEDIIEDSMENDELIPDIIDDEDSNSDKNLVKSEGSSDSKKKTSMVKSEGVTDISFGSTSKNLNDMTYSELMKYKLSELQCFAEECSIDLLKTNGKKKTKSNLSKDIVDHFSKQNITSA